MGDNANNYNGISAMTCTLLKYGQITAICYEHMSNLHTYKIVIERLEYYAKHNYQAVSQSSTKDVDFSAHSLRPQTSCCFSFIFFCVQFDVVGDTINSALVGR